MSNPSSTKLSSSESSNFSPPMSITESSWSSPHMSEWSDTDFVCYIIHPPNCTCTHPLASPGHEAGGKGKQKAGPSTNHGEDKAAKGKKRAGPSSGNMPGKIDKYRAGSSNKRTRSLHRRTLHQPYNIGEVLNFYIPSESKGEGDREGEGGGVERAMHREMAWPTRGQDHFILKMNPSYIGGDCRPILGFTHAEKYLKAFIEGEIALTVNDHTWFVRLKHNRDEYRLGMGWRTFAEDNELKVGDVCVFQRRRNYGGVAYTVKILCA